jgi:hypothetical protein
VTVRIPSGGVFGIELVVLFGGRSQITHPGGRGDRSVSPPSEYSSLRCQIPGNDAYSGVSTRHPLLQRSQTYAAIRRCIPRRRYLRHRPGFRAIRVIGTARSAIWRRHYGIDRCFRRRTVAWSVALPRDHVRVLVPVTLAIQEMHLWWFFH